MTPKNISYDFKSLKKQGMIIWSKRKLSNFVFQYGQTRVLNGYAACLVEKNGKFLPHVTSNQLMKLVKFDRKLGSCILNYLLDFEQRLNSVLITTILSEYQLPQSYVLNLKDEQNTSWLKFRTPDEKENFLKNMYQNVDTCNFLKYFPDKQRIPLISLSLSWTFFNTLLFFESVSPSIQTKVIEGLGLENWNIDSFRAIGHIIRRIRNTISHNDCLLISKFDLSPNLSKQLNLDPSRKFLYLFDICNFLDLISSSHKSLTRVVSRLIKKQFFTNKILRIRIGKLLGWDLSKIRAI